LNTSVSADRAWVTPLEGEIAVEHVVVPVGPALRWIRMSRFGNLADVEEIGGLDVSFTLLVWPVSTEFTSISAVTEWGCRLQ